MRLTKRMMLNASMEMKNGFPLTTRGNAADIVNEAHHIGGTIKDVYYSNGKISFPVDVVIVERLARNEIRAYHPAVVYQNEK